MKSALSKKNSSSKQLTLFMFGASGRMGTEIIELLKAETNFKLVSSLEKAKVVLDFSSPEGNLVLLKQAKSLSNIFFLIGTTGLSSSQKTSWEKLAKTQKHTVLFAPNTSLGVFVLAKSIASFAKNLVPNGFDVEMIETHHNQKKDAPSGTALFLAKMVQKELPSIKIVNSHQGLRKPGTMGIHAVRGGGVFGEHEIRFISKNEEVTISHRAFSRQLFASGAISLAKKLLQIKNPGIFSIEDLS